jgi:hypothetical protein
MTCVQFNALLAASIDGKIAEIMTLKISSGQKYLTYADGIALTSYVREIFTAHLKTLPKQIAVACQLSEAVLAPTAAQRIKHIKTASSLASGVGGIAMIIGGIGLALGWGRGIVSSVVIFLLSRHFLGQSAWRP